MDLQSLKQQVQNAGFPEEISSKMLSLINDSMASGTLSEESRQKLEDLVKIAMEMATIEADANEDVALVLTSLADEAARAQQMKDIEEKRIDRGMDKVMSDLGKELDASEDSSVSAPGSGLPGMN